MLLLSEIWIYPVKSLGGISLNASVVLDRGLEHDRRWMLVDEEGVFLSQRTTPQLALFSTDISDGFLKISHKSTEKEFVKVPLFPKFDSDDSKLTAVVWDDSIASYEVDKEVSEWFSAILKRKVRLVYMPEDSNRSVDPKYALTTNDVTSFSDGFPYLIIGQSSLDDLNARMAAPITIKRFRPNFVFTGGVAYQEETFKHFKIGSVSFYGTNACERCVLTNVDPERGVIAGKEPLFTLSKYKRSGKNVIFGQNVIAVDRGNIKLGDLLSF
ncbi:MOSC domain-containing protein [Flavobacterium algicola]|uniref:MOSC domain-containing protein n=1 Tax=Flavobacterium algicola TaxID=556529 RepID=UPI001EFC7EF7|nr:MOSC N-terminal beta barrel domain-containing protein [Flavobacterium algicola]MCG9791460.1 MOSC N-terminal beta barrel domain-containing protein [Flavobacterium algicola]